MSPNLLIHGFLAQKLWQTPTVPTGTGWSISWRPSWGEQTGDRFVPRCPRRGITVPSSHSHDNDILQPSSNDSKQQSCFSSTGGIYPSVFTTFLAQVLLTGCSVSSCWDGAENQPPAVLLLVPGSSSGLTIPMHSHDFIALSCELYKGNVVQKPLSPDSDWILLMSLKDLFLCCFL